MRIRLAFCLTAELPTELSAVIDALPFGENEKTRLRSMRNEGAKRESLAALVALRRLCGDAFGEILRDGQGKPYFSEACAPQFSLSHTGGAAVAAICEEAVGVDWEAPRALLDASSVANRFFTEAEQAELSRHGDFFALWTRKEARAKCCGVSLSSVLSTDLALPTRTYRGGGMTLSLAAEQDFEVEFLNDFYSMQEVIL